MAETAKLSISKSLDMAVAKMPWAKRQLWQWRLGFKRFRDKVEVDLAAKAADDEECCRLVPQFAALAAHGEGSVTQEFGIDPANIDAFIAMILKWLPQILEAISLIIKFFPVLVFVLVSFASQSAVAQCEIVNGQWQCRTPVRNVVSQAVQVTQSAVSVPMRMAQAVASGCNCGCQMQSVASYSTAAQERQRTYQRTRLFRFR